MVSRQLIFVYNADGSLFGTITDFAHKISSPASYQCKLCALTYGNFVKKPEWKTFLEGIPVKTTFLHRDQFLRYHKTKDELPAIFYHNGAFISPMVTKEEINNCLSLEELMALVSSRLSTYDQYNNSDI